MNNQRGEDLGFTKCGCLNRRVFIDTNRWDMGRQIKRLRVKEIRRFDIVKEHKRRCQYFVCKNVEQKNHIHKKKMA